MNLAFIGRGSASSGNNTVVDGRGLSLALIGPGATNSGNNVGGRINIAILPGDNAGNCSAGRACVNILGLQLLGG